MRQLKIDNLHLGIIENKIVLSCGVLLVCSVTILYVDCIVTVLLDYNYDFGCSDTKCSLVLAFNILSIPVFVVIMCLFYGNKRYLFNILKMKLIQLCIIIIDIFMNIFYWNDYLFIPLLVFLYLSYLVSFLIQGICFKVNKITFMLKLLLGVSIISYICAYLVAKLSNKCENIGNFSFSKVFEELLLFYFSVEMIKSLYYSLTNKLSTENIVFIVRENEVEIF